MVSPSHWDREWTSGIETGIDNHISRYMEYAETEMAQ